MKADLTATAIPIFPWTFKSSWAELFSATRSECILLSSENAMTASNLKSNGEKNWENLEELIKIITESHILLPAEA